MFLICRSRDSAQPSRFDRPLTVFPLAILLKLVHPKKRLQLNLGMDIQMIEEKGLFESMEQLEETQKFLLMIK